MSAQSFQKGALLIELVWGVGAGTLPTVCAGAHAPRRVKQSLKVGCPNVAESVGFAQAPSPNGVARPLRGIT